MKKYLVVPLIALMLAACAKDPVKPDLNTMEDATLAAWMAKYRPASEFNITKDDSGIYTRIITSADPSETEVVEAYNWLEIELEGMTLDSLVFLTRTADTARVQGTFTYFTHYVPDYVNMNDYAPTSYATTPYIVPGVYLKLWQMKVGDEWELYIPSRLAYGSSGSSYSGGYQGQYAVGANKPVIIRVKLVSITKDAEARELEEVNEYAQDNWGLQEADTIATGLYFQILDWDNVSENPVATSESTIYICYTTAFLDGFVFDSNIDTVRKRLFDDYTAMSDSMEVKSSANVVDALTTMLAKDTLRYGSWNRIVTTSTYAYGSDGSTGNTVIPPYTPLVFEFYIKEQIEDDE